MKKLEALNIDDISILDGMSTNKRLASHALISKEKIVMANQYHNYKKHNGDPWQCTGKKISSELKGFLEKHYKNPFHDILYINKIRKELSPDVCPLCGSPMSATLDHYLPQSDYPEWIIYSENLIPACFCNSKRQNNVKGNSKHERILHPYFDNCLKERIVSASFNNTSMPNIDIIPLPTLSVHRDRLIFHINTVVKKSTIIEWMEKKWAMLEKNPSSIIGSISPNEIIPSLDALDDHLRLSLNSKDHEFGTPNNWYSMFLYGLYSSSSIKLWLLTRHNGILNKTIDPLD